MTMETKIETAASWMEQLDGLRKTIQLAREQAAKLDSSKRAVEKAYQLQEKIRKDAESNYEAVQKMSKANLAHIVESYLGFSINPASYLPDLPDLEGYSEFRKSAYYDPQSEVNPSTAHIDRFLSSVTMIDSLTLMSDNPAQNYYRRLYEINGLAGAYGNLSMAHKKSYFDRLYLKVIPRLQQELLDAGLLLDSTRNPSDIVALTSHISRVRSELEAALNVRDLYISEQVDDAVRAANVKRIVARKQQDILTLLAVALAGYSHNKGFSLRKLAAARKAEEKKVWQEVRESLSRRQTGALFRPEAGTSAKAGVNPFLQAGALYSALREKVGGLKKMWAKKEAVEERVVIVIDCSDWRPTRADGDGAPSPALRPLVWDVPQQTLPLPTPSHQPY
jgi:hypothetical protein